MSTGCRLLRQVAACASSDKANGRRAVGSLTIGLPRSAALRFAFAVLLVLQFISFLPLLPRHWLGRWRRRVRAQSPGADQE